jgi:hypothetical protein
MSTTIRWKVGAELPDITFVWNDSDGTLINFASGWTFSFRIDFATAYTQTTGITGAATSPNVTVAIPAAALDSFTPGIYAGELWATRTSDSKDRNPFPFTFELQAAIT